MNPNPAPPIAPAPALIEQAARLLLEARSPVMVAGPEITRYDAERQAVELTETLGMAATYLRFTGNYCPFPSRHPLFLGQFQRGMRVPRDIDVVLFLGGRMPSGAESIPRGAKVIQVTTDARAMGRERTIDVAIIADPLHTAAALTQAVRSMATEQRLHGLAAPRTETIRTVKEQADRSRQEAYQFARQRNSLGWEVLFAEMDRTLDRNALLIQETAPFEDPMYWFDFGRDRKKLITSHTQQPGSLGMGLGVALGAKLAEPDRQVVLFSGDGAMLFTQLEMLWSAARYRAPIIVVVFNNRSYDLPRRRKAIEGGKQFKLRQELTSYLGDPDINFAKVAEAFSVKAEVISAPGEIRSAFERAIQANREGQPVLDRRARRASRDPGRVDLALAIYHCRPAAVVRAGEDHHEGDCTRACRVPCTVSVVRLARWSSGTSRTAGWGRQGAGRVGLFAMPRHQTALCVERRRSEMGDPRARDGRLRRPGHPSGTGHDDEVPEGDVLDRASAENATPGNCPPAKDRACCRLRVAAATACR